MEIELLTVGKTKISFVKAGLEAYLTRLKRYISYSITEIADVRNAGRISEGEQKNAEGKLILERVQPSDYVILLDEHGKQFTSRDFAEKLQQILNSGRKRLLFIVGGPYGFSESVYSRADSLLSLSKMTFNHEMVRLFFTEQVYRAMTILRGEPYHHD